MKEFKHASTASWGAPFNDVFMAKKSDNGEVRVELQSDSGLQAGYYTRRDLTAIIAGLTAIRDAMPEGE
jgi:hypothetical protein